MNSKIIEIKQIAPGMVKIETSIEGLLTIDRYIEIAKQLLQNGLDVSSEKLKDVGTPEATENMLLYQELDKEEKSSNVKEVAFSVNGQEYLVNLNNIDRIHYKQTPLNSYASTIKESIEELFIRG